MSNLDDKVNGLIADIKLQSENENKAITREMAEYREASLKEAELSIANAAKKHVKRSVESGTSEISSELASKHMNARNELVSMRSKMTDEIIQRAASKLSEFTKTDKYPTALCKSAKEIAEVLKSNFAAYIISFAMFGLVFVILHYQNIDDTINCINSIKKLNKCNQK